MGVRSPLGQMSTSFLLKTFRQLSSFKLDSKRGILLTSMEHSSLNLSYLIKGFIQRVAPALIEIQVTNSFQSVVV